MTVPDFATDCGMRPEGKTPRKDLTFPRVHNICVVSIRSLSRISCKIYANGIIKFEIKYTRDGFGQRLAEFQSIRDIANIEI